MILRQGPLTKQSLRSLSLILLSTVSRKLKRKTTGLAAKSQEMHPEIGSHSTP